MGAILMRSRAELRAGLRSWIGVALLGGLAGGLVIASAAGARRTDTAYERLLADSASADVFVYNYPDPGLAVLDPATVEALPQVAAAARGNLFYASVGSGVPALAPADSRFGSLIDRARIVDGRKADASRAEEVTVSVAGADEYGLALGTRIPLLPEDAPDDTPDVRMFKADLRKEGTSLGVPIALQVVGIQVGPGDLPPISTGSNLVVYGTPALHTALAHVDLGDSTVDTIAVRLHRPADLPAFMAELERLAADRGYIQPLIRSDTVASVARAIGPLTTALWLVAGLFAVSSALILGQALARQTITSEDDAPTLRAIGMRPAQIWGAAMIRAAAAGLAAAALAVTVAIALSSALPLGIARIAEPDPGFNIDAFALGVGAVAVIGAIVALTALPAWRAASGGAASRLGGSVEPARAGSVMARIGAPTSIVAGAQLAFARGRGRLSVPVRTTTIGIAVAVAALSAGLGIAASFDHMLGTPRVYGQNWDRLITNYGDGDFTPGVRALSEDPEIAAAAYGDAEEIEIEGTELQAMALSPLRGDVLPPVVTGRRPSRADEIALGGRTLRALRAAVGDTVGVTIGGTARPMRVVGRIVIPAPTAGEVGEQALLDYESIKPAFVDADEEQGASIVLVRFTEGTDIDRALERLEVALFPEETRSFFDIADIALRPQAPVDVVNFGRVENLPFVLGAALGVLAAAVLAHMVWSSVARRRRDLAILKTLGFGRGQIRAAVGWQASLLVIIALLVGIPAGVVAGRWAWTALADRVGILPVPRVPLPALAMLVPGALLLANLVAALPGRSAARTQPALVLRTE
jgi:ABC-type lipoprotein release transport system permease subunit